MISQLVETENDLSTWWAPNNYGKRLSQLVGRSALDYYCGNCALQAPPPAFSKRAFAAQRLKATQVLNNFIVDLFFPKKSSCLHWLSWLLLYSCMPKMREKGIAFRSCCYCSARASSKEKSDFLFLSFSLLISHSVFQIVTITNKALFTASLLFACVLKSVISWIEEKEKRASLYPHSRG